MKKLFKNMDKVIELIRSSNNIYIASHINPDVDSIGSTLALTMALRKMNKNIIPISPGEIPRDYRFLPGLNLYKEYSGDMVSPDLFIALDCGDADRLASNKVLLEIAKNTINIDHHVSNTNFADVNLVEEKISSTGEIIYHLIKNLDIEIDPDIASCLYTGISTDTGSFIYDNVSAETHDVIADLIRAGIDKADINIQLYGSRSLEKTQLFINVLSTLNLYNDNKIAVVHVTQKMLEETGTILDDTEGIISFVREIEPVEVACILKESEEKKTKISMRSKKYIDVSEILKNFNGGGHIRAAGGTIYENIQKSETIIVDKIKEYFRWLNGWCN